MPTTSRDYALNVIADITEYQKRLGQVPGVTDKQAARAALALEQRMTAAQKKAAKAAEDAAKKGALAWSDAFKLATVQAAFGIIKEAVNKAGEFAQANADAINDINDLATRTGVAAETIHGLQVAFEGSGQAAGDVNGVLAQITAKLATAQKGSKEAATGFGQLGVDIYDAGGKIRSADSILKESLVNLAGVEDPATRAQLAVAAFGEQGAKLLQALGDPSSLATFIAYADQFGRDIGPEASKAAGDWQRGMADLKMVLGGFDQVLEAAFGVSSTAILDGFVTALVFGKELIVGTFEELRETFGRFGDFLGAVIQGDWGRAADAAVDFAKRGLTGALIPAIGTAYEKTQEFTAARESLREATAGATGVEVGFAGAIDTTTEKVKELKEELKGFTDDDLKDFIAEWDRWRREVAVSETSEELVELQERIQDINDAMAEGFLSTAEGQRLRAEADAEYWAQFEEDVTAAGVAIEDALKEARQEAIEAAVEIADVFLGAFGDIADAAADFAGQELDARLEAAETYKDQVLALNEAILAAEDEDTKARLVAAQETAMAHLAIENAAAKRAFEAQKKGALAGLAIDTASAIVQAFADLGPIFGAVATAGIVALAGVQAGAIASETFTPYHSGGAVVQDRMGRPDEVPILGQTGEVVQSRAGVTNMGGPEVAGAFNNGTLSIQDLMGGGQGGALYLRHELVDRVVTEASRMTGSGTSRLLRATRPRGWRNHHDRRAA